VPAPRRDARHAPLHRHLSDGRGVRETRRVPIVLALCSAVVYGVADYCGGRASRRHPSALVTVVGQSVSLVLVLAAALVMGTTVPGAPSWAWGGAAGVAGAIGLASLYHALSHGAMTVVAPLTAVVSAVIPVVVGVAGGERPERLAVVGMVLALASIALVSGAIGERDRETPPAVLGWALVAGTGFGILFVALERTDPDSGLWPLVAARAASVPLLLGLCAALGVLSVRGVRQRALLAYGIAAGVLDMAANVLYLEAARRGLLSLVAVITALYPASTVTLAFLLDRERVSRWQAAGMAIAGTALVLVTLGRS